MDINHLRNFIKIAELQHMTKAAQELNISQSALSQSVSHLENELGVALFDRLGRNIILNQYGIAYLAEVKAALEHLDCGYNTLKEMKSQDINSISVIAPTWFGFQALISEISTKCKGAKISVFNCGADQAASRLKSGEADLCVFPSSLNDPELDCRLLRMDEMGILVSASHPLANCDSVPLESFKDYEFAAFHEGISQRINCEALCAKVGWIPKITFEADNYADIVRAVSSGRYVAAVVRTIYLNYGAENLRFISLSDISFSVPLSIYWVKDRKIKPIAKTVREIIINHFEAGLER